MVFLTLGVGLSSALAAHPDTNSEIENLKQRIEALEAGLTEEPAEESPFSLLAAGKHLTLGGLLELEANDTDIDGGDSSSDLTLATAELSLEVVNELPRSKLRGINSLQPLQNNAASCGELHPLF